jgi:hypothetical protein
MYEAPGTNILQSWTVSGDSIISTTGSVTLTRNAYCIELVPGEPMGAPSPYCVALDAYKP